jgi:hypothetical protein
MSSREDTLLGLVTDADLGMAAQDEGDGSAGDARHFSDLFLCDLRQAATSAGSAM